MAASTWASNASVGRAAVQDNALALTRGAALSAAEALLGSEHGQRLSVMIFHRVLPQEDPFVPDAPSAAQFESVMSIVAERFNPLSLPDAVERLARGTLPPKAVCVTFDDGYADNLLVAMPILERLGIPVTIFVATGFLDGGAMWNDRLAEAIRLYPGDSADLREFGCGVHPLGDLPQRARVADLLIRRLKYGTTSEREGVASTLAERYAPHAASLMLSREQVRELRAAGAEIGGHTVTHPILALSEDSEARREIAENKEDLEGLLGERLRFFAYPNGKPGTDFAPTHAAMVKSLGFKAALTTRPGVSTPETDRFWLRRFTPWDRTPTRFALRLLLNMRRIV